MYNTCTNPSLCNGEAGAFCKKALLARSFCCFTFFGPKTPSFLASHALFSCFTCPRFWLHLPTCLASHPLVCCFCCLLACSLWSSHSPTSCFTCSHILLHMLLNLASHGLMCFFTCWVVWLSQLCCLLYFVRTLTFPSGCQWFFRLIIWSLLVVCSYALGSFFPLLVWSSRSNVPLCLL